MLENKYKISSEKIKQHVSEDDPFHMLSNIKLDDRKFKDLILKYSRELLYLTDNRKSLMKLFIDKVTLHHNGYVKDYVINDVYKETKQELSAYKFSSSGLIFINHESDAKEKLKVHALNICLMSFIYNVNTPEYFYREIVKIDNILNNGSKEFKNYSSILQNVKKDIVNILYI